VHRYVALGDSYSSGAGIPTQDDSGCSRSDHDYPHLLARRLGARLVDVTCAGATTDDLSRSQLAGVRPQLDAVTPDTDLVTIGIGGNDLEMVPLFFRCAALRDEGATPCRDATSGEVTDRGPAVRTEIVKAVAAIRAKAPAATILVVGYPQPFPTDGTCARLPFTAGDARYAAAVMTTLNGHLETAAERSQATYVDLAGPSRGHDICSASPWVNGAVASSVSEPIHPFAVEHRAVARLLADALG
jgi:lysophospholipase L1-like esterase